MKPSLLVAVDIKRNQLQSVLDIFSKRLLRLRIVQHTKRVMPSSSLGNGNFELDSDQLSVESES